MKKLHESQTEATNFVPDEGQHGLLCSNKSLQCCPSLGFGKAQFSEETIQSLCELGEVLKKIRKRLILEGIITTDGKLT